MPRFSDLPRCEKCGTRNGPGWVNLNVDVDTGELYEDPGGFIRTHADLFEAYKGAQSVMNDLEARIRRECGRYAPIIRAESV